MSKCPSQLNLARLKKLKLTRKTEKNNARPCWVLRTFAGPQAESTRIETNIPGNDFVELVVALYGFEEISNFVKDQGGKRDEDILCNATHSV